VIQIKRDGSVSAHQVEDLRAQFARHQCVVLPQLLEPELLTFLLSKVSVARLVTKQEQERDEEFGEVLFVPETEPALFVFHLLLNNRRLFQVIEQITGCLPVGNFSGRIHRSDAGAAHHIAWHGDNADHRLLGLTMNLSTVDYGGGLFQLRRKASEEVICEVARQPAGDAFIFRIAPDLQHRLTVVESHGYRTVGVGWFRGHPDFRTFAANYFRFAGSGIPHR
jgi:hypothetical protein